MLIVETKANSDCFGSNVVWVAINHLTGSLKCICFVYKPYTWYPFMHLDQDNHDIQAFETNVCKCAMAYAFREVATLEKISTTLISSILSGSNTTTILMLTSNFIVVVCELKLFFLDLFFAYAVLYRSALSWYIYFFNF